MRRRKAEQRVVPPDPQYDNVELARFINRIMLRGKKTVAQRIVYSAMEIVEQQAHRPPLEVFQDALRNATPLLQVKARRVGGATYQIPIEVPARRGSALAMRWIINSARARKGRPMHQKLAQEFLDASRGDGAAVKRREDLHRMAEANRAFVHYRW
ncbi:MAG: 30S ribosomal protein S7 [Chloroflexota bacterium]|nr:30S ribosomal protein S7 [Chloroflexota bacterium]MDE2970164.1 30S ribosomal protein S7 [Chloroflexota bacterium]